MQVGARARGGGIAMDDSSDAAHDFILEKGV